MENELQFAIDVVSKACSLTRAIQQDKTFMVFNKEDKSPVTVADFTSQLLITHYLQETFPNVRLVAEENITELGTWDKAILDHISGLLSRYIPNHSFEAALAQQEKLRALSSSNRYWVLDPIDGTKGFLRGEQYVVALGLIEDGVPVLGVLGCPNLNIQAQPDNTGPGIVAYSVKNKGAWIKHMDRQDEPVRLSVSSCSDASEARFLSSVKSTQHSNTDEIQALKTNLKNETETGYFDSQAKYVMVAAGKYEVFIRQPPQQNNIYREKIWDHAAGYLIVNEAGGIVTDINGKPFDFTKGNTLSENYGVVVSNGHIHASLIGSTKL